MKLSNYFSLIYLLAVQVALADEMDDFFSMSPAELAEITVSIATGSKQSIIHSPAVTSVITAKQIKAMGATQLNQVLETIPGLHVRIQAVTGDGLYTMRGMSNHTNAQVLVMLNGNRYSVPYKGSALTGMSLPVEAIQQIEVIRGPGSALYGADAFAGVINIITKKAGDIDGTEIGIRGGSWDSQSIWGLDGRRWLGWDIATTLQYRHNTNDNQQIITRDLQSRFDSILGTKASLAPGVVQSATETWNVHLNMQRQYWDLGFWAFNEIGGGLREGTSGSLDNEGSRNGENYLGHIQFSSKDLIAQWKLTARASYLYTRVNADIHNFPDRALLPVDQSGNINPTGFGTNLVFFPDGVLSVLDIQNKVANFKSTISFQGIKGHLWRAMIAYRYEQTLTGEQRNTGYGILNGSERIVDGTLTDVTGTDLTFLTDSNRSIWSVSLQDEWQISADWQLTAGVRYDHYSDFGDTINPRAAIVWDVNSQLTAKLLYGEAFRAPSFLEQKQKNSLLFIGNPELEPESIQTFELALIYRPLKTIDLTANIYYYAIENLIVLSEDSVPTINNLDYKQSGLGVELEWLWHIRDDLTVRGNYSWQKSKNQLDGLLSLTPGQQIYLASSWQFLPQWQLQTQLNWINWKDNKNSINQTLSDYSTVDLTLNSPRFFNHIDFTTSIRNLFNTRGQEPAPSTYPDNFPIHSRSFYLETSLHF